MTVKKDMKARVLFYHPSFQHSHQFPLTLFEFGMLSDSISGIQIKHFTSERWYLPSALASKIILVGMPKPFMYLRDYGKYYLRYTCKVITTGRAS